MARRNRKQQHSALISAEISAPVIIESLDQEGRGVAHVDGKTIFIDGALPTEKVTYQITPCKSTYAFAHVAEILKQSNLRVTPLCRHYGVCGGCKLQHLDFSAQVAAKQRLLENDLKHIGKVTPENMLPPLDGAAWGYRHTARLSVKYVQKKQRVLVGFNEKSTRFVADMDSCEVLTPAVSALITPLQEMILQLSLRDKIPQLELAVGGGGVIVLIFRIMNALHANDEALLRAFAEAHQVNVWTQTKGPETVKPFYAPSFRPQSESSGFNKNGLQYTLPEFDLVYPFKPNEFTQVNPQINQVMIRRAMQLLAPKKDERIVDFFCGIGNFTLPIARSGAMVWGFEGLENLVARAVESAALNDLSEHSQFGVSDLFKMTSEALTHFGRFDKWLVDPPRDGAFELVKSIHADNSPQKIVYVSCNPATLARDADILVNEKGYRLSAAGVINMFPHTTHVESIALFTKIELTRLNLA
ncbi:MAG: 23S rRNA (uracil(1939)-C(5))-methyltransferase RlmD [Methylophilaceae bacterium]